MIGQCLSNKNKNTTVSIQKIFETKQGINKGHNIVCHLQVYNNVVVIFYLLNGI